MHAGKDDPRPFSDFWPGTEGLVNVAITCYNRAFSTPAHQYSLSFEEAFDDAYHQVSLWRVCLTMSCTQRTAFLYSYVGKRSHSLFCGTQMHT
jgi:hypothetical protein